MNFKSILEKIFEKIKNTSDKQAREKAYNYLEESISKNYIYKHQFELLKFLEENKGKIKNSAKLQDLIDKVNGKNYKFIKENKNINSLKVWQENKKLLEYFNINPNEIIPSVLDKAIDINADKKLNEYAIKSYIGKVRKVNPLNEIYKTLVKNKSVKELNKAMKKVRIIAEKLSGKDQVFVYESLSKLRELKESNFDETVKKLYKLHLLTENLLKEFQTEIPNENLEVSEEPENNIA